ncbi:hypothetical protein BDW22DRAFT_1343597 [Trametopsis cervina]|nr:hypothetical protein BDW22DRAFT_1343597 [Trametopsis cervina]
MTNNERGQDSLMNLFYRLIDQRSGHTPRYSGVPWLQSNSPPRNITAPRTPPPLPSILNPPPQSPPVSATSSDYQTPAMSPHHAPHGTRVVQVGFQVQGTESGAVAGLSELEGSWPQERRRMGREIFPYRSWALGELPSSVIHQPSGNAAEDRQEELVSSGLSGTSSTSGEHPEDTQDHGVSRKGEHPEDEQGQGKSQQKTDPRKKDDP